MGIKSLSLQMIPWCFHMGGVAGQVSCVQMRDGAATSDQDRSIKVIKSDGVVKVYHRPINVSDLMVEFPKHLVCRSDSFTIGQKIPALSDKEKLQLGHNYFLLPKHLFQSALSFVAIASFAASSATNYKNALLKTQPFIVRKAPSGSMQIRVSEEFISKLMMQSSSSSSDNNNKDDDDHHDINNNNNNKLCTTAQLVKEYSALVESRQCWKPKLETIRESKRRRSLGSFGIKTRPQQGTTNKATTYKAHQSTKTSTTTHQQQQQQQQKQIKSSSSSSSGSAMAPSSNKSSSSSSKSASSTKSNTSKGSSVASAKKKGKKVNSLVRLIN
ncbi:hypothetical protein Scep_020845 [Stephania cephalantha]|uniref:Uncharacterized protein n=1 Tax=Stephania cephalantha TaxID=152367 RepID=A0AAP0F2A0_9MAGN